MIQDALDQKVFEFCKSKLGEGVFRKNYFFKYSGLDETEGEWFLIEFSEEFNVDMADFNFRTYFPRGGCILLPWNIYLAIKGHEKFNAKVFSIDHFVEVAKKGKWFEPE